MFNDKKRILIVEDEMIIAEDIRDFLEEAGYNVIDILSSGEETIEKIDLLMPDMILMDIMLAEEMNGLEASDKIHKKFNIPVIFVTALRNQPEVLNDLEGKFNYITKPYKETELLTAMEVNFYRQVMEEKLLKEKKIFSDFLEISPIGVIRLDTEGKIQYLNPKAIEIFDIPANDLLNEFFSYPFKSGEITEFTLKKNDNDDLIINSIAWDYCYEDNPCYIIFLNDVTTLKKEIQAHNNTQNQFNNTIKYLEIAKFNIKLAEKTVFTDANSSFIKAMKIDSFQKVFELNPLDIFVNTLDFKEIQKKIEKNQPIEQMKVELKDTANNPFPVLLWIDYRKQGKNIILDGFFKTV